MLVRRNRTNRRCQVQEWEEKAARTIRKRERAATQAVKANTWSMTQCTNFCLRYSWFCYTFTLPLIELNWVLISFVQPNSTKWRAIVDLDSQWLKKIEIAFNQLIIFKFDALNSINFQLPRIIVDFHLEPANLARLAKWYATEVQEFHRSFSTDRESNFKCGSF